MISGVDARRQERGEWEWYLGITFDIYCRLDEKCPCMDQTCHFNVLLCQGCGSVQALL